MRLATLASAGGPITIRVEGEEGIEIPGLGMLELIEMGAEGLERAAGAQGRRLPFRPEQLLAPIPSPRRNIMCLGLNYVEHARESLAARGKELKLPAAPVFFTKATNSVNAPYGAIPFDPAVSESVDWEAELGVVVGRRGKNIERGAALDYVFGYTVINDTTARDLQTRHTQFFKGKSLDGYCPMGPWIVTADEVPDPYRLRVTCRVNGELKQDANTSQLLFDISAIIESLSRGMTIEAGDVIATGTPSGVGFARTPPEFLKPGDVVETEVESIGVLRNVVTLAG